MLIHQVYYYEQDAPKEVGIVTEEIEVCLGITWLGLRSQKLTQAEGKSCVGPRTNRA